jgi:hypothetical protein
LVFLPFWQVFDVGRHALFFFFVPRKKIQDGTHPEFFVLLIGGKIRVNSG